MKNIKELLKQVEGKEVNEALEILVTALSKDTSDKVDELKTSIKTEEEFATFKTNLMKEVKEQVKEVEFIKNIQTQLDKVETEVKKVKEVRVKPKGFVADLREQIEQGVKDCIVDGRAVKSHNIEVDSTKAVGDMAIGDNITGDIPLPWRDPMIQATPERSAFILNHIQRGSIPHGPVTWVERSGQEGAATAVAEKGAYPQLDVNFVERSTAVKKFAVYTRISEEFIDDIDFILSEMRTELFGDLERLIDTQIVSGAGTGANLSGLTTNGASITWNGTTQSATNKADQVLGALTQLRENYYNPSVIVVNPADYADMLLMKDDNGNYVLPTFGLAVNNSIHGVPLVQNTAITAGNLLVFDGSRVKAFFQKGIQVELWDQNASDPIQGFKTMTGKARLALRIMSDIDTNAIFYDSFADINTAMTT